MVTKFNDQNHTHNLYLWPLQCTITYYSTANVVFFGIDQLQDASTDEITSFISWYSFTYFGGGIIIFLIDMYLGGAYNGLLEEFIICICLTVMIIFIDIFIKPIIQNPFSLNLQSHQVCHQD